MANCGAGAAGEQNLLMSPRREVSKDLAMLPTPLFGSQTKDCPAGGTFQKLQQYEVPSESEGLEP